MHSNICIVGTYRRAHPHQGFPQGTRKGVGPELRPSGSRLCQLWTHLEWKCAFGEAQQQLNPTFETGRVAECPPDAELEIRRSLPPPISTLSAHLGFEPVITGQFSRRMSQLLERAGRCVGPSARVGTLRRQVQGPQPQWRQTCCSTVRPAVVLVPGLPHRSPSAKPGSLVLLVIL